MPVLGGALRAGRHALRRLSSSAAPPPAAGGVFVRAAVGTTAAAVGTAAALYVAAGQGNEAAFGALSAAGMAVLRAVDAETAHVLAVRAASAGLLPAIALPEQPVLKTTVWGLEFSNPVGLAAGFDKHAEAMDGLLGIGLGFVEVGSVTPKPQVGNAKPRVFRLPEDGAVINRYGFNSHGHEAARQRLAVREAAGLAQPGIVGVNLGKNKEQTDAAADYCAGIDALSEFADYVVINVSSPNTPGLRKLQGRQQLHNLLSAVQKALAARDWSKRRQPPLLVKIAPDLTQADMQDIAAVVKGLQLDGLIVSNTTIARPDSLASQHKAEKGGLSGKPLLEPSTVVLREMYRLTDGKIPIIGVGGVSTGADAYKKIRAGASLVQLYSAMSIEGPSIVPRIRQELAGLLERDGFGSVADAVGADARD